MLLSLPGYICVPFKKLIKSSTLLLRTRLPSTDQQQCCGGWPSTWTSDELHTEVGLSNHCRTLGVCRPGKKSHPYFQLSCNWRRGTQLEKGLHVLLEKAHAPAAGTAKPNRA